MHTEPELTHLVERVKRNLERAGHPRLVMLGVLAASGASGFLASVALVHLGVGRMPVRYPLAVAFAYATFLGLLWWWLRKQLAAQVALGDAERLLGSAGTAALVSAALGEKLDPSADRRRKSASGTQWLSDLGGIGDIGVLGEGLGMLLFVFILAGACTLIVSLYLVFTAPVLLAELLVDGALLGAMSRGVAGQDPPRHWSSAVVRKTWLPAVATAAVFALIGLGIEHAVPGAHTLGQALSGK